MFAILAPILYFVLLFGGFEVIMFRRGLAYWQHPFYVIAYFLVATVGALVLFSLAPVTLMLQTPPHAFLAVAILFVLLFGLAWHGYFTYHGEVLDTTAGAQRESYRYVVAKSFDIIFQDTLVIIVALALSAYLGSITWALISFSIYFLIAHSLLASVLPLKFALIFIIASFFAGVVFASIVLFGFPVVYIFILHWLFYAATYALIKRVRKEVLPSPVYQQLYGTQSYK